MLSRRSHKKSRFGCLECKRRKVKCGEQRPACIQCSRRHVRCEYGSAAPRSSTTSDTQPDHIISESGSGSHIENHASPADQDTPLEWAESSVETRGKPVLDRLDLEIFYSLITSLPKEMKSTPESNSLQFWTEVLPTLMFKYDFILHLALALAAQFMTRQQGLEAEAEKEISLRAFEHYQSALPSFIQRLADVNELQVLWVGSLLMCLHSFACRPRPGEYLIFSDAGDPEWYTLFRGARNLWELSSASASAGERPTPSSYDSSPNQVYQGSSENDALPHQDRESFFDWLRRFRELLETLTVEDASYAKYTEALDALETSYVEQYGAPDSLERTVEVVTHSTFAWLFRISDEFVTALQAKKSVALVIFAFYVPILYDGQPRWLTRHWCHHLLSGTQNHLHPHYSRWIQWVLEYTKWDARNNPL